MWTPARRRGVEILDDPATPDAVRERAMADVARANLLFGGTRAAMLALREALPHLPRDTVLLDVGTGMADIAVAARAEAERARVRVTVVGLDISEPLLRRVRPRVDVAVVGSALRLPVADDSVDVVICSQLLHHFVEHDARSLIAELHRVSRGWVVISDLRRSRVAAAGFWLASTLLRFDRVTRADGVVSVFRGFTRRELASLVREASGAEATMRRSRFWRVSATWRKA